MVVRREADAVRVAESPRHGLDAVLRVRDLCPQDRAGAHALARRVLERRHYRAGTVHAMVGVAARRVAVARIPDVLAEGGPLARDVVLVAASAVVVAGDSRVRGRTLRPVEPAVLHEDLLGRVIARRQPDDERGNRSARQVDPDDARSVVAFTRRAARSLVGIGREQLTAFEVVLEGETDRRAIRLEPAASSGRFADRTARLVAPAVEDQDAWCEWIRRAELADAHRLQRVGIVVVAFARKPRARLQHVDLEVVLAADECHVSREIQALGEHFDLETPRHDNVFAVSRVVEHALLGAIRVDSVGPGSDRDSGDAGNGQRGCDTRKSWWRSSFKTLHDASLCVVGDYTVLLR